jgi:hypothetical protein
VGDFSELDEIYQFQFSALILKFLLVFPGYFLICLAIPWDFFGFSWEFLKDFSRYWTKCTKIFRVIYLSAQHHKFYGHYTFHFRLG